MSLIIDALKKAQELRSKESQGASLLKNFYPKGKKRPMSLGKRWSLMGFSLLGTLVLLFLIWKSISLSPHQLEPQVIASIKMTPSSKEAMITKEIPEKPLNQDLSESPQDPIDSSKKEINSILTESDVKEKKEQSLSSSSSLKEKAHNLASPKKRGLVEKPSSIPLASLNGEVSQKSLSIEREGKKESPISSEVINHFNLGVSYQNQKNYSKAIESYKKAIELDPTYIEAYNNLGILHQEIGEDNGAFEIYQKLIKVNPRYEKAYNNLGVLFYKKGRYEEAVEAFQKAIAINPDNIESYINLGVIFKKQGQWGKAVEVYQKALSLNPLHKETHYNMGLLYEQIENLDLAIEHYQRFVELASNTHPELAGQVQRHLVALESKRNK